MKLTHARLLQVLRYVKSTGEFWWIERSPGRVLSKPAGTKDDWYVQIMIDGVNYHGQRLAWFYVKGEWPVDEVDHRNRIKSDNRWRNLRAATHKQNTENSPIRRHSRSQIRGVYWEPARQRWHAYIDHNGKRKHLGRHKAKRAAVQARRAAEKQLFTHA